MARTHLTAALGVLVVYLGIPTKNYFWDGVYFATTIENARRLTDLIHPNHLVYNFLAYGLYRATGGHFRALYILQVLDAVFAAATVYVLSGIIHSLGHSRRTTLLLTGLFAFSGTWWKFATDADAYVPAVFFLVLTASFLLPDREARPAHAAISHVAAILLHQLAILFFPAALAATYAQYRKHEPRRRLVQVSKYAALAVTLTVLAYSFAYASQKDATYGGTFWQWITSHSPDTSFSFDLHRNAITSLRSWVQLFLIGRLLLVRLTDPWSVALVLAAVALAVLSIIDLIRCGLPGRIRVVHGALLYWNLVWVATYAAFLFFWLPYHTYYKLFALPGVILLVACCTSSASNRIAVRYLAWLVAVVATANLAFGIVPYSRIDANGAISFAVWLRNRVPAGSVVYYWEFNTDDSFAQYFNPQTHWQRVTEVESIDAELSHGRLVWLETTAIDHLAQQAPTWFAARTTGSQWLELVNYQHRIRFVALHAAKAGKQRSWPPDDGPSAVTASSTKSP